MITIVNVLKRPSKTVKFFDFSHPGAAEFLEAMAPIPKEWIITVSDDDLTYTRREKMDDERIAMTKILVEEHLDVVIAERERQTRDGIILQSWTEDENGNKIEGGSPTDFTKPGMTDPTTQTK